MLQSFLIRTSLEKGVELYTEKATKKISLCSHFIHHSIFLDIAKGMNIWIQLQINGLFKAIDNLTMHEQGFEGFEAEFFQMPVQCCSLM